MADLKRLELAVAQLNRDNLLNGGELVFWCRQHHSTHADDGTSSPKTCWAANYGEWDAKPCRMVEAVLLAPDA